MDIPTSDNYGQAVHPDVIYISNGLEIKEILVSLHTLSLRR